MENRLATIIVIFYPEIKKLKRTIELVSSLSDIVVIFNNTHQEIKDTDREKKIAQELNSLLTQFKNTIVLDEGRNIGLSKAYNDAVNSVKQLGVLYYFILDQDSIINKHLIPKLIEIQRYLENNYDLFLLGTLNKRPIMSILERIENAISKKKKDFLLLNNDEVLFQTNIILNSGMFLTKTIFSLLEGFNENLFTDAVDLDFCYRAKRSGCKIFQYISFPIIQNEDDKYILKKIGINLRKTSVLRQKHIIYDSFTVAKAEFKYSHTVAIHLFLSIFVQSILSAIFLEHKRERFSILWEAFFSIFS
jgi:GT2 family glycosyltransferase